MTRIESQGWVIRSSLAITAFILAFFIISPPLGYPLTFAQSQRLIEISVPVFLGYLGTAASFIFRDVAPRDRPLPPHIRPFISIFVKGPIVVFSIIFGAIIFSFYWSNRPEASPGSGMSIDEFAIFITVALGILTVTTNAVMTYLFNQNGSNLSSPSLAKPRDALQDKE